MNHAMSREQFKRGADPLMKIVNDQFAEIFGVEEAVETIKGATQDLQDDNNRRARNALYAAEELINEASADQCLHLFNCLTERVSELTGTATELEDAASALTKHIAWEASRDDN